MTIGWRRGMWWASFLVDSTGNGAASEQRRIFRQALDAIEQADAIVLGPGSLFESVLPNLLIPEVREAMQRSKARTIYICSLMTEPGLTSGFGVADHIRQISALWRLRAGLCAGQRPAHRCGCAPDV